MNMHVPVFIIPSTASLQFGSLLYPWTGKVFTWITPWRNYWGQGRIWLRQIVLTPSVFSPIMTRSRGSPIAGCCQPQETSCQCLVAWGMVIVASGGSTTLSNWSFSAFLLRRSARTFSTAVSLQCYSASHNHPLCLIPVQTCGHILLFFPSLGLRNTALGHWLCFSFL